MAQSIAPPAIAGKWAQIVLETPLAQAYLCHLCAEHEQEADDFDGRAQDVHPHRLADPPEVDEGQNADEREQDRPHRDLRQDAVEILGKDIG